MGTIILAVNFPENITFYKKKSKVTIKQHGKSHFLKEIIMCFQGPTFFLRIQALSADLIKTF